MGVTVIVPAYNEETGIGPVLARLQTVMQETGYPYEICVVDDGSTDHTAEIARTVNAVCVIYHRTNRGYGAALKTGLRRARYGVVAITDADGTYPNEQIPALMNHLLARRCDMVVGARTGAQVAIPRERRPAKWAIGKLANWIAGESIPDLNSGLRVFRREMVLPFFSILPDGFSFTTTITLGMLAHGCVVDYLPIDYHPRVGRSKIRPIRDTLNFVQLILRLGLYFAPLKIFLPASGIILALALIWGVISLMVFHQLADVSTLVMVMAAIQVASIGLLAELINRRMPALIGVEHRSLDEGDENNVTRK
jgi:glycosyltransferase involved in cell wall biosynthesis